MCGGGGCDAPRGRPEKSAWNSKPASLHGAVTRLSPRLYHFLPEVRHSVFPKFQVEAIFSFFLAFEESKKVLSSKDNCIVLVFDFTFFVECRWVPSLVWSTTGSVNTVRFFYLLQVVPVTLFTLFFSLVLRCSELPPSLPPSRRPFLSVPTPPQV